MLSIMSANPRINIFPIRNPAASIQSFSSIRFIQAEKVIGRNTRDRRIPQIPVRTAVVFSIISVMFFDLFIHLSVFVLLRVCELFPVVFFSINTVSI